MLPMPAASDRMPELLLIDINVLGIGSMHEYEFKSRTHGGRDTGAIHGALKKLADLLVGHRDKIPIALWPRTCIRIFIWISSFPMWTGSRPCAPSGNSMRFLRRGRGSRCPGIKDWRP